MNIQGNKNPVETNLSGDIRIDDQPKNPVANNLDGDTTTDDQPKNPVANNLDGDTTTDDQPKNPVANNLQETLQQMTNQRNLSTELNVGEMASSGKTVKLAATPLSGDPKSQDYSHPAECSYTKCCVRLCVMGTKETTM